jgi:hypothetical protein
MFFPLRRVPRAALVAAALAAIPSAQVGHYLAYWLRLGPAAVEVQARAEHAYYLSTLQVTLAVAGSAVLLVLVIGAVSRALNGLRSDEALAPRWSLPALVGFLLVAQLAVFFAQEMTEALAAGVGPPDAMSLLVFGLAGQAPVALAAGLALRILSATALGAVHRLRRGARLPRPPASLASRPPRAAAVAVALGATSPVALLRRGPPSFVG